MGITRDREKWTVIHTAEGSDPRWITHVTVAAAAGFGTDEVAALNALRTLKREDDLPELRVQLVGLGVPQDFRAPLLAESTVWISATPFVATRFPKTRGSKRDRPEDYASPRDFVRHVLQQELQRRAELPSLTSIEEQSARGGFGRSSSSVFGKNRAMTAVVGRREVFV